MSTRRRASLAKFPAFSASRSLVDFADRDRPDTCHRRPHETLGLAWSTYFNRSYSGCNDSCSQGRVQPHKSPQALQGCTAAAMRVLLLVATAWALAPISTPPKRTEFREGIGGATKEQAVAVGDTVECAKKPIGPRDVVIRCYDISSDGKQLCGNQPVRRWRGG